jgi:hypothetical protein
MLSGRDAQPAITEIKAIAVRTFFIFNFKFRIYKKQQDGHNIRRFIIAYQFDKHQHLRQSFRRHSRRQFAVVPFNHCG